MAQLLAGGILTLGLLAFAFAIFLATREKKIFVSSTTTISEAESQATATLPEAMLAPAHLQQAANVDMKDMLLLPKPTEPILLSYQEEQSSTWWQEQFHSLTAQLHYLREHAKDVERQIAILGEISTLVAELETLQKKRDVLPEGKLSPFPLHVHRQPTDISYLTEKRPAVRKYAMKAMS